MSCTRRLRTAPPSSFRRALLIEALEARTVPSFLPAVTYWTNGGTASVAVADFDGDEDLDIASTEPSGGTVSVLLNRGQGTFQNAVYYRLSGSWLIYDVAVGDFNRDGAPDLAVASWAPSDDSGRLSVLLNRGNGSFDAPVHYDAGARTHAVAVADFNGDGVDDVVTANLRGARNSLFLGVGDGTFPAALPVEGGGSPVAADFNGDGTLDLAGTISGGVVVLPGYGDGTFAEPLASATGDQSPAGMAVGDFDFDGVLDLAVANRGLGSNSVSVLRGLGDGTFEPPVVYAAGVATNDVTVADVNADGVPDLVAANHFSETVTVLLGAGDGTFLLDGHYRTGRLTMAVVAADFNGDGASDLVTAEIYSVGVSVLLNAADWGGSAPSAGMPPTWLWTPERPTPWTGTTPDTAVILLTDVAGATQFFAIPRADGQEMPLARRRLSVPDTAVSLEEELQRDSYLVP